MTLAIQPDLMPTNKLLAFAVVTLILHYVATTFPPPEVIEAWLIVIEIGIPLVVAWFVKDRANIPVN